MATLRTAAGNVLSTVSDGAQTISNTFNTLSGGVSILNGMVQHIRLKQTYQHEVDLASFEDNLLKDASLDAVKREENIRSYIGNDTTKQELFNEFHQKLSDRIAILKKAENPE